MPATYATSVPVSTQAVTLVSRTVVSTATLTVTISSIPSTYRQLRVHWMARSDNATIYAMFMRINGDTGANYHGVIQTQNVATITPAGMSGSAYARVGVIGGTTTPTASGQFGTGVIDFHSWNTANPTLGRLGFTSVSQYHENGSNAYLEQGGFFYNAAPPYTSLSFYTANAAVSSQAGSEFSVYGLS